MRDERILPQVDQEMCSLCGLCAEACGCGAVSIGEQGPVFSCPAPAEDEPDRGCTCMCEEVCPSGAIEVGFEIVQRADEPPKKDSDPRGDQDRR